MSLALTPDEQATIKEAASQSGVGIGEYLRRLMERAPTMKTVAEEIRTRNQSGLSELLDRLMVEGDPEEQRETWEILRKGLEAARDSNRMPSK
jgi:hypothetical protein